jgi:hypothetical protein
MVTSDLAVIELEFRWPGSTFALDMFSGFVVWTGLREEAVFGLALQQEMMWVEVCFALLMVVWFL